MKKGTILVLIIFLGAFGWAGYNVATTLRDKEEFRCTIQGLTEVTEVISITNWATFKSTHSF